MPSKTLKTLNSTGYIALIASGREFRKLWYGQIVSLLGDWFGFVASATLVAGLSKSGLAIGILIAVRMLPPFLVSPVAGVVADRFNRKHLLILTDVLRAFVVLGFLFVRRKEDIWIIYVLTAIQMALTGFFYPARNAILPDLVKKEQIGAANALTATTWSVMLALGAALGGVFSGRFGIYAAFAVDAATYLVSALILARLIYTQTTPKKGLSIRGFLEDYLSGLNFLKRHKDTLFVACQKMAFAFFMGGAMEVVQVSLARDVYPLGHNGSTALGIMYAVTGLGTGLGPIALRWLTRDDTKKVKMSLGLAYFISVGGLLIMAPLPGFAFYLAGGFLRGVGSGINWVFSSHLLMSTVDTNRRGRVFSTDFAFFTLAHALSTLLAGVLMDQFGLKPGELIFLMAASLWIPGILWSIWVFVMNRSNKD